MSKLFCSGEVLHQKLVESVTIFVDFVGATLGPRGRNVLLREKNQKPFITKDGVTVAHHLKLDDPVQDALIEIIKQAAAQTNHDTGDGTTTSAVLASAIILNGLAEMEDTFSPVELKKGIDATCSVLLRELESAANPVQSVEDIKHIATISANGDSQIGSIIALAIDKVGKNGSITIEESRSYDTVLDLSEGFKFDSGFASSAFITDQRRGTVRHENPLFLITDAKISEVETILPALEIAARQARPFVIVADEVTGQALAALIMNTVRGSMRVCAVKSPRYGEERTEIMSDLALALGANFIQTFQGDQLEKISLVDFGAAKTIEINRGSTVVVGGAAKVDNVSARIELIQNQISEITSDREASRLQERITRLSSGIAIIRVGGATQVEVTERRHRVEDALEAVRAAQAEGVLPGGGTSLLRASQSARVIEMSFTTPEARIGHDILIKSLFKPFKLMAENCGIECSDPVSILETLDGPAPNGYNFLTGELVNLIDAGIIEPAKVTRCSLQNAVSVAGALLTANHIIVEEDIEGD